MKLSGQQYQQLRDALIDAFPEQIRLAEVLQFRFGKNLNAYALGNDLRAIVFRLIQAAEAEGWVDQLIAGARESNPGNPSLFILAQELNLAISMPPALSKKGELERVIKKTIPFLKVSI